jgi:hypothetical protein
MDPKHDIVTWLVPGLLLAAATLATGGLLAAARTSRVYLPAVARPGPRPRRRPCSRPTCATWAPSACPVRTSAPPRSPTAATP